jgi:hypothetical protein
MELKRFGKLKDNGIRDLDNRETHIAVAATYAELVRKASGKTIYFLSGDMESKKYRTKLEQVRKMIQICVDFGVTFEQYMQVQFDKLIPWLKRTKGLQYPPFNMLISDGAVTRFNEWQEKHGKQYESKKEARQALSPARINYFRSMFDSAEYFHERLQNVGTENVLQELEMLARLGKLTKLYIFTHPLVQGECRSYYLKTVRIDMKNQLTDHEKEVLMKYRKELDEKYKEYGGHV